LSLHPGISWNKDCINPLRKYLSINLINMHCIIWHLDCPFVYNSNILWTSPFLLYMIRIIRCFIPLSTIFQSYTVVFSLIGRGNRSTVVPSYKATPSAMRLWPDKRVEFGGMGLIGKRTSITSFFQSNKVGQWFSKDSFTNKTDWHDVSEILLHYNFNLNPIQSF